MNAGEIQDMLMADGIPVIPNTVRLYANPVNWTAEYSQPLSGPQQALASSLLTRLEQKKRANGIREKASLVILARFPMWKQINMLARYAELQGRYIILPGTEAAAELAALEACWDWVKAVRAHSDELEADPSMPENWPTY